MSALHAALRAARAVRYEWGLVVTLSVTETISWGVVYYGFPVFLQSMERSLGASRVGVTGALSVALAVSSLVALPVGRWLDLYGPRTLMTAGSCLATTVLLVWAQVGSLSALYVTWGVMGLAMAAILYEPAFATVVQWLPQHRDRALLVVTMAAGFASTIFMPLEAWLLERLGWREAIRVLALFLGATTIPLHALVLRTKPRSPHPAPRPSAPHRGSSALSHALATPAFWALAAAFTVGIFSAATISVHMIPYLVQHGYPPTFAAALVGWIGAMQVVGRLLFVPAATWLGPSRVTAFVFLAQGAAMALLPATRSPAGVVAVTVLLGATNGMATLVRATVVAELFGREAYATISGALASGVNGARALAPVGASLLRVWLGGYERVFWTLAAGLALAGLLLWGVVARDRPPA